VIQPLLARGWIRRPYGAGFHWGAVTQDFILG
jgi:hypothetical protein